MLSVCQQQTDLATENVCCGQIAFLEEGFDNWGMVKRPTQPAKHANPRAARRRPPQSDNETLYLGQWLAQLGREQQEVAQQAKVGKSYVSHLVSGKKTNPATKMMLRISGVLGVTINDLYKPPPARAQMDQLKQYEPSTIRTLIGE